MSQIILKGYKLLKNEPAIRDAIFADIGKPSAQSQVLEILCVKNDVRLLIRGEIVAYRTLISRRLSIS
jgi:hypothetical protein